MPNNFPVNFQKFNNDRIESFFKYFNLLRVGEDSYQYEVNSIIHNGKTYDFLFNDKGEIFNSIFSYEIIQNHITISWKSRNAIEIIPYPAPVETDDPDKIFSDIIAPSEGLDDFASIMTLEAFSYHPNDVNFVWQSSDENVAVIDVVDNKGAGTSTINVIGLKEGEVKIYAIGNYTQEYGSITIKVIPLGQPRTIFNFPKNSLTSSVYISANDNIDINYSVYSGEKFVRNSRKRYITTNEDVRKSKFSFVDSSIMNITREMNVDDITAQTVFNERQKSLDFYNNTMDIPAYDSYDNRRMKRLIIDWYASQKAGITKARTATDPFSLNDQELDELIKSFGFPYPDEISSVDKKASFLLSLINFYHKKGSPSVLKQVLSFFGISDVVLTEWWIEKDYLKDEFVATSKVIAPTEKIGMQKYSVTKPYTEFISGDPYWFVDEQTLEENYNLSRITLPSITPIISVQGTISLSEITPAIAIISRKMQEAYEFWLEYVLNLIDPIDGIYKAPPSERYVGQRVIICKDAIGDFFGKENWIATFVGEDAESGGWEFSLPDINDCALVSLSIQGNTQNASEDWDVNKISHFIFNGVEWVNTKMVFPESTSSVDTRGKLNNVKSSDLFRDMSLNKFRTELSLFEVLLGISYLFAEATVTDIDGIFTPGVGG